VVKLVPYLIITITTSVFLIETHDVHHSLRVLFLLLLRDAILLQQALPLFGQACELAGLVVISDVGDVDRVFGSRDFDIGSRRAQHTIDKARETGLLASPMPGWRRRVGGAIALIGISFYGWRPFGLPMREIHVGQGGEAGGLAERWEPPGVGAGVMSA
jgi:hypothetical protein